MNNRKSLRLPGFDYSQPGVYFVSIATAELAPLLGCIARGRFMPSPLGDLVRETWRGIPCHHPHVRLLEMGLLPDHVLALLQLLPTALTGVREGFGRPQANSLATVVRGFKAACTREWRRRSGESDARIWQGRYLERVVRSRGELASLRCMVRDHLLWQRLSG